jgi:hypothetical protein
VVGDCSLKIRFSRLYNICEQQSWKVSRALRGGELNLTFRPNFNTSEVGEWEELENELVGVQLAEEEDTIRWMLTPHGQFITSSLYRFCTFPGVKNQMIEEMWHTHMPLKMKILVWLVLRNRI